jgi:nitrite reductase/ring-hydroxylating ferredoxin subunit
MGIFTAKIEPDAEGYYPALPQADVREGEMRRVTINRQKVVFTMYAGEVVAFAGRCPHAGADMAQGVVSGWKAICPEHHYCFDLRNGRLAWPPDEPYRLRLYKTKLVAGLIFVQL